MMRCGLLISLLFSAVAFAQEDVPVEEEEDTEQGTSEIEVTVEADGVFGSDETIEEENAAVSDEPVDHIALAENAYLNVDFEAAREFCRQALEEGGHSISRLIRIYELIGVAAAAAGDEEEARDVYIKLLALDPDSRVDQNLAPRLRGPFLEARGFWSAHSERLDVQVRLVRARGRLQLLLSDPIGMAKTVHIRTRILGQAHPSHEETHVAEETIWVPIPGFSEMDRVEYTVEVLDEHGNHLIELGSEDEPRFTRQDPVITPPVLPDERVSRARKRRRRIFGVVLGIVAAAGAGIGLYYGLRQKPIHLRGGVSFQ